MKFREPTKLHRKSGMWVPGSWFRDGVQERVPSFAVNLCGGLAWVRFLRRAGPVGHRPQLL
jgi:hypothetical protein